MYPPTSLQGLLQAFGRCIRERQKQRIIETSCVPPIPFNINTNPRYIIVVDAAFEAARKSPKAGLGRTIKKSDDLTLEEEARMLSSEATRLDCSNGVNNRFVYYCTWNFFIRGGKEMKDLDESMFALMTNNENCSFLRFLPGESKNWGVDINHCGVEYQRKPVDCYDEVIILTYRILIQHQPQFSDQDLQSFGGNPAPLFLRPKPKINKTDNIRYLKKAVGRNTLECVTKMIAESAGITKNVTNKTGRHIGTSGMEAAQVPVNVACERIGHRDPKSFYKYVKKDKSVEDRAMQRIISGEVARDGEPLNYFGALEGEMKKKEQGFEHRERSEQTRLPVQVSVETNGGLIRYRDGGSSLQAEGSSSIQASSSRLMDCAITDSEMDKFMEFYLKMENAKVQSSGAPQYHNLSNVNIFNISNSNHIGNLLSEPTVKGASVIGANGENARL